MYTYYMVISLFEVSDCLKMGIPLASGPLVAQKGSWGDEDRWGT